MKKFKDIIAGSVLFAIGIFYYCSSLSIKLTYIDRVVGSRKFPQIVAFVLMFCALVILIKGILDLKKIQQNKQEAKTVFEQGIEAENSEEDSSKRGNLKVFLVLISFAIYCFLMDKIGFGVASFLYLFSQMLLMKSKKPELKDIVFYILLSAVLAVGIYILFYSGFKLMLPKANWF